MTTTMRRPLFGGLAAAATVLALVACGGGGGDDCATGGLVQPDGKIVAVGQADNGTNGNVDFVVLRLLP